MSEPEKKEKVWAIIEHEQPKYVGENTCGHIVLRFCYYRPDDRAVRIRYTGSWTFQDYGFDLDGLQASCQYDSKTPNKLYGWEVGYQEVFTLKLREAEEKFKTLKKIDQKLKALRDEWGDPESYGAYLMRVCKVLNVVGVLTRHPKDRDDFQTWKCGELPMIVEHEIIRVREALHIEIPEVA